MSFTETGAMQVRPEVDMACSTYSRVSSLLKRDGNELYGFFQRALYNQDGGNLTNHIDPYLTAIYGLNHTDVQVYLEKIA